MTNSIFPIYAIGLTASAKYIYLKGLTRKSENLPYESLALMKRSSLNSLLVLTKFEQIN